MIEKKVFASSGNGRLSNYFPKENFYKVNPSLINILSELKSYELPLFIFLLFSMNEDGVAWPGNETIMKHVGCTEGTLSKTKKKLVKKGLLLYKEEDITEELIMYRYPEDKEKQSNLRKKIRKQTSNTYILFPFAGDISKIITKTGGLRIIGVSEFDDIENNFLQEKYLLKQTYVSCGKGRVEKHFPEEDNFYMIHSLIKKYLSEMKNTELLLLMFLILNMNKDGIAWGDNDVAIMNTIKRGETSFKKAKKALKKKGIISVKQEKKLTEELIMYRYPHNKEKQLELRKDIGKQGSNSYILFPFAKEEKIINNIGGLRITGEAEFDGVKKQTPFALEKDELSFDKNIDKPCHTNNVESKNNKDIDNMGVANYRGGVNDRGVVNYSTNKNIYINNNNNNNNNSSLSLSDIFSNEFLENHKNSIYGLENILLETKVPAIIIELFVQAFTFINSLQLKKLKSLLEQGFEEKLVLTVIEEMGLAGNNASYTFTRFEIMANTNIFTMDSYRAVKTNYNSAMKNKISFDKFLLQLQENKKSYIEIMDAVNQIAASSNRQNQNLSLKKNKYDELYSGESYEKKDKYLNKNKTSSCSKKSNSDADNNNRKNTIQHEKLNNETVEKLSKAYKKNFGKNIDVGLINVIADYVKKGLTPDLIEHGLDNSINAERNQRKYFLSTLNNWATSDIKTLEDMQNDSKMRKAASSDTYFPSMSGQSKNTGSTDNVDSRTQKKISLYEKEIAAITEKLSKKYQIKIDKSKALSWFEVAGKNISEIENVIKKSDNYEIFKKNVLSVGFK